MPTSLVKASGPDGRKPGPFGSRRRSRPAAARRGARESTASAAAPLRAFARRVLRREGVTDEDVNVILAGDVLLRELNARFRGKDRATDVLSFTYRDQAARGRRALEGEIFVSLERVRAQARRYRHTPGAELARLVTHGLLHLCGHDHMKAGERRVMRAAEREALGTDLDDAARRAFELLARQRIADS